MGICQHCIHFRPVRPASQLLERALNYSLASAVASELTKISDEEYKLREAEAQFKRDQATLDRDQWRSRPLMSDFCGLRESEEVYLIAEVKNFPVGRCRDYAPGQPPKRSCSDCAYRVKPHGGEIDVGIAGILGSIARGYYGAGGVRVPGADNLLRGHQEGIGPRKAQELVQAYHAQGHLFNEPQYLEYCRKFSTNGEFVVCVLQNPHDTCSAWQAQGAKPAASKISQPTPQQSDQRFCDQCGAANRAQAKYCVACGRLLQAASNSQPAAVGAQPAAPATEMITLVPNDPFNMMGECGGYFFDLGGRYLTVMPKSPDPKEMAAAHRRYDCQRLPMRQWVLLQDQQGASASIRVYNDRGALKIQVGPVPAEQLPSLEPVDDKPSRFEALQYQFYEHPTGGYKIMLDNVTLWLHGPFQLQLQISVLGLPEGQWRVLQDKKGNPLPIRVCRRGRGLLVEWLP